MASNAKGCAHFFWAGVLKHTQTGGIVPSQRYLVEKMVAAVPETFEGVVLELGAGNGAVTVGLARRCPQARIVASEINPVLARDLQDNLDQFGLDPSVEVRCEPASTVLARTAREGRARYIVSSLPLGNFGRTETCGLLDGIREALIEGGTYVQFQHALFDLRKIKSRFPTTRVMPVLLNFPPAFVYYAQG